MNLVISPYTLKDSKSWYVVELIKEFMIVSSENASIQLLNVLDSFPLARLAGRDDGGKLAAFMNEHSMQAGLLDLTFTRGMNYFSLLDLQGHRSISIYIEVSGKVMALGSLTIRHSFMRKKKCVVGYFQDLRISSDAPISVRLMIYNCMTEVVRLSPHLIDTENCNLFYTAILSSNSAAKAALSRSKFVLEYTKLFSYRALAFPKLPGARLFRNFCGAREVSYDEAINFYTTQLGQLAFDVDVESFQRLRAFSKAFGVYENSELQGCCFLVDMNFARQMNLRLFKIQHSISLSNTLIFGLRIAKNLSTDIRSSIKTKLLRGALVHSGELPGLFCGYIQAEDDVELGGSLLWPYSVTKGDVYRIYHPENMSISGFETGFLRPDHLGVFEWALS